MDNGEARDIQVWIDIKLLRIRALTLTLSQRVREFFAGMRMRGNIFILS